MQWGALTAVVLTQPAIDITTWSGTSYKHLENMCQKLVDSAGDTVIFHTKTMPRLTTLGPTKTLPQPCRTRQPRVSEMDPQIPLWAQPRIGISSLLLYLSFAAILPCFIITAAHLMRSGPDPTMPLQHRTKSKVYV